MAESHLGGSTLRTGSSSQTTTVTQDRWKGHEIQVRQHSSLGLPPSCPSYQHDLHVVHHHGENGEHYCPTGFLQCDECTATAHEPGDPECTVWGAVPS